MMPQLQRFLLVFQHTAARRRLQRAKQNPRLDDCFNTQPPEGGCAIASDELAETIQVSTHSRPKAAAKILFVGFY